MSQKVSYYGDSLAWPIPSNLNQALGSSIKIIESKLKVSIWDSMSNVLQLNVSKNESNKDCSKKFYPVQTCSSVCGLVVMCMGALLCDYWKDWDKIRKVGWVLSPTQFSDELRVMIMQWILAERVETSNLGIERISNDCVNELKGCNATMNQIESQNIMEDLNGDENDLSQMDVDSNGSVVTSEVSTLSFKIQGTANKDIINGNDSTSDDDFQNVKKETRKITTTDFEVIVPTDSDSDNDLIPSVKKRCCTVESVLPKGYEYKFESVDYDKSKEFNFNSNFKIDITCEETARKWVQEYNETTKETMVYERNRKGMGKNVIRKLYMRCQHKQRETGKHVKSSKRLKTTFKEHNNKQTHCPAQLIITVLAPNKKNGNTFLVTVDLKHTHNHPVHIADALRFRRVSNGTCEKYYDLFKVGHSPASAHLEYETNLMLEHDSPQALADRSMNQN